MNRLTNTLLAMLLFAGIGAPVVAQEGSPSVGPSDPDETEIVVPELVLEVEEIELQQVTAVLPEEGELALGQVSIPLPGADELEIADDAFSVPLPGAMPAAETTSVFSSGRLGAGSANHIVGELSLFKLGADPRFRLRFSHEGLDGYQFNEAGTGYFSSSNVLDGWFAGGDDRLRAEAEAAFSEKVDGLQGQSDYYSAGLRRTTATASVDFNPDPLITLSADFDGSLATRIQSVSGGGPVPRE